MEAGNHGGSGSNLEVMDCQQSEDIGREGAVFGLIDPVAGGPFLEAAYERTDTGIQLRREM